MQKFIKAFAIIGFISLTVISCKKNDIQPAQDEISQDVLTKIQSLGFSTAEIQKIDEGYLVEGDIVITNSSLNEVPTSPKLRIAGVEQYNTFNLVKNDPRTINVSTSGTVSAAFSVAVDSAIKRYNDQSLSLTFQRVPSGGHINIRIVNTGQYIASAGFPTSGGEPYHEVKYAKMYSNYSTSFMTTVIAHELGHCIGFRHTDYMNRAYSCGSGGNEGQETTGVGAIHIPGTPTGPDAKSWMLACLSSTTNRPFNPNDVTALKYLY